MEDIKKYEALFEKLGEQKSKKLCFYLADKYVLLLSQKEFDKTLKVVQSKQLKTVYNAYKNIFKKDPLFDEQ